MAALVGGFGFRLPGSTSLEATVRDLDTGTGTLRLDRQLPDLVPGALFEIVSPEEAPILAARIAIGSVAAGTLPPLRMRLATTRATNALLERKGAPVAFFVTRGFGDLLAIGTQQRPDLFALEIRSSTPLAEVVYGSRNG